MTTACPWSRLPFFLATDALKTVERGNWIHAHPRLERVAEHSWHVTLLAMLYADAAPDSTNHDRVRELLIVHDLVEMFAGDTRLLEHHPAADVAAREAQGHAELMALLPADARLPFEALWQEFQAQTTS